MKLPVFVYDYTAKQYLVFPCHLLTTLSNGKQGIAVHMSDPNFGEKYRIVRRYHYLFQHNFQMDAYTGVYEYTLKEQR